LWIPKSELSSLNILPDWQKPIICSAMENIA